MNSFDKAFEKLSTDLPLDNWENAAHNVLTSHGITWNESLTRDHDKPIVNLASEVMLLVTRIRNHIIENNYELALTQALYLSQTGGLMLMEMDKDDKLAGKAERVRKRLLALRRGEEQTKEREPKWKEWQDEANILSEKYPNLSKRDLAQKVKKNLKLKESVETIRKRI